jgi:uncharacterized membrane protein YfcA
MGDALLTLAFLTMAALYSAVGHGGGSGYLAVMALAGLPAAMLKPTALSLNILVAGLGTLRFGRAGFFNWRLFWPMALGSVPAAFLGGSVEPGSGWYRPAIGILLVASAGRLAAARPLAAEAVSRPLPVGVGLVMGALVGGLSGLIGIGGGIFLSPLLVLAGYASVRQSAGVTAPFILVNSVAALAGQLLGGAVLPSTLPIWGAAVLAGGWLGTEFGTRRLTGPALRRVLAAVLAVAGLKMIFAG